MILQVRKPLVYLACPYSHPDRAVRVARFESANHAAGELMRAGHHVYSPTSHTHPIAEAGDLPLGWNFWEQHDRIFISMSHKIVVVTADGWRESKGVTAEIAMAEEFGIPVEYMAPAEPVAHREAA